MLVLLNESPRIRAVSDLRIETSSNLTLWRVQKRSNRQLGEFPWLPSFEGQSIDQGAFLTRVGPKDYRRVGTWTSTILTPTTAIPTPESACIMTKTHQLPLNLRHKRTYCLSAPAKVNLGLHHWARCDRIPPTGNRFSHHLPCRPHSPSSRSPSAGHNHHQGDVADNIPAMPHIAPTAQWNACA